MGPAEPGVAGFAVGVEGDATGGGVEAEELEVFAAAGVLGEDDGFAGFGLPCAAADGFREERELAASGSGVIDRVELGGIAEAGGDEDFGSLRVPAEECRGAEFHVGSGGGANGWGDVGDAVADEPLGGGVGEDGGGCDDEREQAQGHGRVTLRRM